MSQYPQLVKPDRIPKGDFKEAIWQQYVNTLNSLKSRDSESFSIGDKATFRSYPSFLAFEGNVVILEAMLKGKGLLDDTYRNSMDPSRTIKIKKTRSIEKEVPDYEFYKNNGIWSINKITVKEEYEIEEQVPVPLSEDKFAALTKLLADSVFADRVEDMGFV